MVSTRRTRFPSPPPNIALARPVPDDPPPPPPPLLKEISEGSEALKCSLLNTAISDLKSQQSGLAAGVQRGQSIAEHVIKATAQFTEKSSSNDGDATASTAKTPDVNPDAPEEESFSAAKASAHLQMKKESHITAAPQEKRKRRPRARASFSRDNGQRNFNSTQHESFNKHSSPRALPISVLEAMEGVITSRRSNEKARRTVEKLRKQKRRRVSREKTTFLKDMGVAVLLPGRQKHVSSQKQPSAASFLQNSIGKQGPRVSAEISAKIAGITRT